MPLRRRKLGKNVHARLRQRQSMATLFHPKRARSLHTSALSRRNSHRITVKRLFQRLNSFLNENTVVVADVGDGAFSARRTFSSGNEPNSSDPLITPSMGFAVAGEHWRPNLANQKAASAGPRGRWRISNDRAWNSPRSRVINSIRLVVVLNITVTALNATCRMAPTMTFGRCATADSRKF